MGKWANDDIMDAALNFIRNNVTRATVCTAQPLTFAEANAALSLGDVAMSAADITLANGTTSGRKGIVAAKNGVPVDVGGTGNHVALLDVPNSRLLYVTTCSPQAVVANGTFDAGSWEIELGDPV